MDEYGTAVDFIGDEPSDYVINLLCKKACAANVFGLEFQIRRNNHQVCWVSNPSQKRIEEFPILIRERKFM